MAIISHSTDLSLAPTVTPLVRQGDGTLRTAIEQLATAGFAAVQLDATFSGTRPRDLDQRARKDLLALLMRRSLRPAGIDLWIPRQDYLDSARIDRAMGATLAAIKLGADLGRLPLSLPLPVADLAEDAKAALLEAADGHGVALAVHAEDQIEALANWIDELTLPALGAAVDPAILLAGKCDVSAAVGTLGNRLLVARLSDHRFSEAQRCPVGTGQLDLLAYRVALDLGRGRRGPVVLDLRGLNDPLPAAAAAAIAWQKATF